MICDYQTNKVYLAEGIKGYPKVAENLMNALYKEGIDTEFLPYSKSMKHVWARDYMPIQIEEGRFVKYVYRPDYLKDYKDYIPNYAGMIRNLGLTCKPTSLVIDGGNVVKCGDAVIMTDKVLKENPAYDAHGLRHRLEELFEAEVVFIPWDRYEMFGHADGMVRYIGGRQVLLNNYVDFDRNLRERILKTLDGHFDVNELHYDTPRPSRYSWAYLNFLQVNGRIFVPGLGIEEDRMAVEQIQAFYPDHKVVLVPDCLELVRDGGALNCVTWNIACNDTAFPDNDDMPE